MIAEYCLWTSTTEAFFSSHILGKIYRWGLQHLQKDANFSLVITKWFPLNQHNWGFRVLIFEEKYIGSAFKDFKKTFHLWLPSDFLWTSQTEAFSGSLIFRLISLKLFAFSLFLATISTFQVVQSYNSNNFKITHSQSTLLWVLLLTSSVSYRQWLCQLYGSLFFSPIKLTKKWI